MTLKGEGVRGTRICPPCAAWPSDPMRRVALHGTVMPLRAAGLR